MTIKPKKRKMNPMLMNVLLISLFVHVAAIVILGGITVVKYIIPDDAEFEEPPAIEEVEPPKEVKVEIKQTPKPQDQSRNNLKMRPVANIAIANVNVDLPNMEESFTVSGGLGGSGGSSLLGGTRGSLGIGMSDVSVFGLKTRAERILFVIDANRQMVTDKKGGLNSYRIIKSEITDMVGNLSAGTLFNVMLQDRSRTMLFRPQLSSSGTEIHQQLVKWISGINADPNNIGLEDNRAAQKPKLKTFTGDDENLVRGALEHGWRGNETGFMTQYALEQNVDAIFFITGYHKGFESMRRTLNEREQADWEREIARPDYIKQLAEHNAEKPNMQKRVQDALKEINEDRAKRNQPPRILEQRYGVYSNANELNLKWETRHPGHKPSHEINDREVSKYFRELADVLYEDQDKPVPSINVVLFLAGDETFSDAEEKQLKDYVRSFSGKHRVIRGLDQITSASSARDTTN
jgi:hypothetical protein